jgi:hypothetical protein
VGPAPTRKRGPDAVIRDIDDVTPNYLDEGQGRPVVVIGGFTAPATSWMFQQKDLSQPGTGFVR